MDTREPHPAIWVITIGALGIALLEMPYGYYLLLRVLVFCVSCYLAVHSYQRRQETWAWIFIGAAIIYNPIIRLPLGSEIWPIVNGATIAVLGFHLWCWWRFKVAQRNDRQFD